MEHELFPANRVWGSRMMAEVRHAFGLCYDMTQHSRDEGRLEQWKLKSATTPHRASWEDLIIIGLLASIRGTNGPLSMPG